MDPCKPEVRPGAREESASESKSLVGKSTISSLNIEDRNSQSSSATDLFEDRAKVCSLR